MWYFRYICKTVFLSAVLNWIKGVCMYKVITASMGAGMALLSATRPLRLLSCQRFSVGINHSLCQRCIQANAEH